MYMHEPHNSTDNLNFHLHVVTLSLLCQHLLASLPTGTQEISTSVSSDSWGDDLHEDLGSDPSTHIKTGPGNVGPRDEWPAQVANM